MKKLFTLALVATLGLSYTGAFAMLSPKESASFELLDKGKKKKKKNKQQPEATEKKKTEFESAMDMLGPKERSCESGGKKPKK